MCAYTHTHMCAYPHTHVCIQMCAYTCVHTLTQTLWVHCTFFHTPVFSRLKGGSLYCREISLSEFLSEILVRMVNREKLSIPITSSASCVTFQGDHDHQGGRWCVFFLQHFLWHVLKCGLEKNQGRVILRRVEYIHNLGFQMVHRIWFQLALGWPSPPKKVTLKKVCQVCACITRVCACIVGVCACVIAVCVDAQ